jgi:hypothetical protein
MFFQLHFVASNVMRELRDWGVDKHLKEGANDL